MKKRERNGTETKRESGIFTFRFCASSRFFSISGVSAMSVAFPVDATWHSMTRRQDRTPLLQEHLSY
eukprot:1253779-Rhodomonas_salina.2